MGKSLSQTLGLKDPLDDAIHGWIKPGPQQNNYQAPPWWGPNTPTGIPQGGYQTHAALPTTPLAGLPAYVPPAGAPAPAPPPAGSVAPPLVDGRVARGAAPLAPPAAPAAAPSPAALAAGLANVGSRSAVADPNFGKPNLAPAGVINRVNGVLVPAGQPLPPGVR